MNTDPQAICVPHDATPPQQAISDYALQMILKSAEDAADAESLISAMTLESPASPKPPKNWADVMIELMRAAAWLGFAWMLFQYYTLN